MRHIALPPRAADARAYDDTVPCDDAETIDYHAVRAATALSRMEGEMRRLRAELSCLQIIKQRFEAIVDNVPCWLFSCGSNGAVTFMNNGFARYTGEPPSAALGDGWIDFVHPEDADAVRKALGRALTTGVSVGATLRVRSASGEYGRFVATGSAVRDGNGKIVEWYGSLSQLSEHVRA